MKKLIFLITVMMLSFSRNYRLQASSNVIFFTKELPDDPEVPATLDLHTTGFFCSVTGNGRVDGEYEIENKNKRLYAEYSLTFEFYEEEGQKGKVCATKKLEQEIREAGVESFKYAFYIDPEQAKKVRSMGIKIEITRQFKAKYQGMSTPFWTKKKTASAIFALLAICGALYLVHILLQKPKKNKIP